MEIERLDNLYNSVKEIITTAKSTVRSTVNFVTVVQNWEIGRRIVEVEQGGEAKAGYGKYIIKELSEKLINEYGNGYTITNLKYFRQFYLTFPISHALRDQFRDANIENNTIRHPVRDESVIQIWNALHTKTHPLFDLISPQLSWTHYRSLLRVENPKAREFYMKEAVENGWSTRALDRQIKSLYYERLLSSQDKKPVVDEMKKKTSALLPEDVLKDPFVLEFLQLKENKKYLENELEQALIDKMNDFLLELGKDFAFVARQKRISTETKHFYIDLVFYNYLLKCFVLIDLKTNELTHQDIGQMDMYMRLYEDKYKAPDDNPTIGIILCTENDQTIVKYSVLSENKNLFASKYKLYLPTEQELIEQLEREKLFFEQNKKI